MSATNADRMLSKADIKLVKSLGEKSFRYANKLFVAEGSKSVADLLGSNLKAERIYALKTWLNRQDQTMLKKINVDLVSQKDIEKLSSLKSTREVLGLFSIPAIRSEPTDLKGLILALDTIQDPGNLGTIIRMADWYGIETILCSLQTVDCYNTKVVQSSMGSIGRVNVYYGELAAWFKQFGIPVIATTMDGESAGEFKYPKDMILLLGNEGTGINPNLMNETTKKIKIDRRGKAESLNAAMAGAILVDRYFGQHGL